MDLQNFLHQLKDVEQKLSFIKKTLLDNEKEEEKKNTLELLYSPPAEIQEEQNIIQLSQNSFVTEVRNLPSHYDMEKDNYSIVRDYIQLYNGSFLKIPSLTVAGRFVSSKSIKNQWNMMDSANKPRGYLRKIHNLVEATMDAGDWVQFRLQAPETKLKAVGTIVGEDNKILLHENIVMGRGINEKGEACELFLKYHSPLTLADLEGGEEIFILSFLCRTVIGRN